ncbi:MAG TPA: ATP-binding protein, partial [Dehalococcoidia bacterium]|nr:ATP-binding protein [Dehalococcoidia bacterium]
LARAGAMPPYAPWYNRAIQPMPTGEGMPPTGATDDRGERELRNLREENDRLRGRLALLSRLSLRITASLDLSTALQEVVEAACALTGARYGALGIFDDAGRVQQFVTHGVTVEERERIAHLPQGLGLLGLLHQLQQPLRLSDLSQHHRSVGFPANHPPMKTFLGVPLRHGDEGLGNLYLTEKEGGQEFTPEDESLLVLFASQAAMAIWNARLHHQLEAERQRVEAERQRLEALMETSPVGVFVVDAAGAVQLINREAQRVLGIYHQPEYGLEQYVQAAVYSRPDGRPYESHDLPLQRALHRGETVRAEEVRFQFPDGRHVPTLVNATPLYSADGQVAGAIAVIQDITPLEELEQLRSEFLGMVSHELKTPLTAIKGSAATVLGSRRTLSDAESRDLFQIIDEQSDRLRDLVDNLLDMTRIEAGSLSVGPEPVDLPPLLEEARATFARAGGQEVQVQLPDGLPQVNADRGRVVQVLNNLLGNAGKFSPATAPIAILVEHEGTQVTVHVRDRGRGIPANRLPHLFRKFSQVHDDQRHNLSGSGLGLAICKGIVEAHGGRIWAESPGEGGGATFSFTLPVAVPSAGGDPESDGADPAPVDTTRRSDHLGRVRRAGERTRVLAVDDEPQTLRYLQRSLEEAGYQAIVTSDPAQVVRLVELEEPDLVLLDLMLPGTTGFDLLGRIREFSGVPAIFLSARDQSDDAVRALRAGADDYITKPFAPSELLARIEATLRRRVMPDRMEVQAPFVLDNLAVNFAQRRVTLGGQPVSLSATEYKLLYELATHAGLVLTHTQLLQRVWGPEYSGETELVRSFIRNLRRKLGDDARRPRFIFTEPQVGYRMPKP